MSAFSYFQDEKCGRLFNTFLLRIRSYFKSRRKRISESSTCRGTAGAITRFSIVPSYVIRLMSSPVIYRSRWNPRSFRDRKSTFPRDGCGTIQSFHQLGRRIPLHICPLDLALVHAPVDDSPRWNSRRCSWQFVNFYSAPTIRSHLKFGQSDQD